VLSQRIYTLSEVVDSARALQLESAITQKSHEMTYRSVISVEEKGKGKRPSYHWDMEDLADRGVQSLVTTMDSWA